jgi:hypothetical protein
MLHPDIEVLAAVSGCGVDEPGAGFFSDVTAGEQWDVEGVRSILRGSLRSHLRMRIGGGCPNPLILRSGRKAASRRIGT